MVFAGWQTIEAMKYFFYSTGVSQIGWVKRNITKQNRAKGKPIKRWGRKAIGSKALLALYIIPFLCCWMGDDDENS